MNNGRWFAFALAAGSSLALVCCDKKSEPTPQTSPAPSASSASADQELSDEDLAVPEDFLEEATSQITTSNYKTEIDSLEKDISSTPE